MTELKFQLSDMLSLGAAIRGLGANCSSMEEASQKVVGCLWDRMGSLGDSASSLVLARLYKTHRYGDLDAPLQSFARGILGGQTPPPETKCLVLLATRGTSAAWNDRRQSAGHQAIPLPDPEFVSRIPMVSEVFRQFGIEPGALLSSDPARLLEMERQQCGVFLVPEAHGSTFIPAQDFVQQQGVRSVAAFGGVLPSGDVFAVLLFFKITVTRDVADLMAPLALSTKLSLLPFYQGRVFA